MEESSPCSHREQAYESGKGQLVSKGLLLALSLPRMIPMASLNLTTSSDSASISIF